MTFQPPSQALDLDTPQPGDDTVWAFDLSNAAWRYSSAMGADGGRAFLRWFWSFVEWAETWRVLFAADSKPTFRHKLLPQTAEPGSGYKGDRAARRANEEDAIIRAAVMREIEDELTHAGICVVRAEGFEADDVLATVARIAYSAELSSVLVTDDRDVWQCVRCDAKTGVFVAACASPGMWLIGPMGVEQALRVPPARVADYFALLGGKNNVPGVPGVGEVWAAKIAALVSVAELLGDEAPEALLALADAPKSRERDAALLKIDCVLTNIEAARLSLELTRLRDDVPLPEQARVILSA
jgi:DNA polymerase-1